MEITQSREPWNKGKLIGQKPPLKLKDIWAIRIHLQLGKHIRDLAMFNLAIDSKLRGCDLVKLRVRDVAHGNLMLTRAMVIQRKTQKPVQFELTEDTRNAVAAGLPRPDPTVYGTHTMRRTKATLICRRTKNLRAVPTVAGPHEVGKHRAVLGD